MANFEIKIIGQGTENEIIESLKSMVKVFKDKKSRKLLDAPGLQDLDGCSWNGGKILKWKLS